MTLTSAGVVCLLLHLFTVLEFILTFSSDYNKCLDASQPKPDMTGCGATRDSCLDGARYMRLRRSGRLGRLL
jgi:hypothetical protein